MKRHVRRVASINRSLTTRCGNQQAGKRRDNCDGFEVISQDSTSAWECVKTTELKERSSGKSPVQGREWAYTYIKAKPSVIAETGWPVETTGQEEWKTIRGEAAVPQDEKGATQYPKKLETIITGWGVLREMGRTSAQQSLQWRFKRKASHVDGQARNRKE